MTTIRALFSSFRERGGETFPSSPSSYATVVMRKCRTLLLTKLTIMKLKTDVFSVSIVFL